MNAHGGTVPPPGQLYVRALYDYEADDRTSLSFRQGDVIQVITQLDSGWWDGVIHGTRGWFPSNYCAVISRSYEDGRGRIASDEETTTEESEEDDREHEPYHTAGRPKDAPAKNSQEEAAYWIPQATPDGRLFYFNTLTGQSTMELPLEAPTSADETGPRDRTNVYIPEHTRPPPEMMAAGYERNDDDGDASASDAEEASVIRTSKGSSSRRRRSLLSEGVSPATSVDSLSNSATFPRSRAPPSEAAQHSFGSMHQAIPPIGTTMQSFANASVDTIPRSLPRRYFPDTYAVPLTWNTMVEDMRRAVQRYRDVINAGQRSEFARKAEDMSDHLRLLLAAGSGTTDNHTGNPCIISDNKALHPHFRALMSRFSRLMLSSHLAAVDWPQPDAYQKCLQEVEGVLQGVYGFVEVARRQRGEEIPRLTPGFVSGSRVAGNWHNNGLKAVDLPATATSFIEDDGDLSNEPREELNQSLLEHIDDLRRRIVSSIRQLDEHLVLRHTLITPQIHRAIGDTVCRHASHVVDASRPYLTVLEGVNLAPPGATFTRHQLAEFAQHKQNVYDCTADLILACQAVTTPLADEWAEHRGPSLEERLHSVHGAGRALDTAASQIAHSLQRLSDLIPSRPTSSGSRVDGVGGHAKHARSSTNGTRPPVPDTGPSGSHLDPLDTSVQHNFENPKVQQVMDIRRLPAPSRDSEDTPPYLTLDHEDEIAYDIKVDPPQLRGGTLTGLVEQLTRHDRPDFQYNATFLLTYKSFTTAPELFEMLVRRWSIQPPPGLSGADLQLWTDKKQKPIRFRVVNILKSWFDNHWMELNDEPSSQLVQRVYAFAKDTVQSTSTPGAAPLMTSIEQRMRGHDASSKRLVPTQSGNPPAPIIPRNMKKLKFLDIDVLEFARQLTVIESKLYCKIKPTECLDKTWQKKLRPGEPDPAENVKALILHSNQLTNWVAQMILTQADVKRRVVVIKHFVAIADKCRGLNNFSCLTSIISALGSAPITRLGRTWAQVNARTTHTLESMRTLMGSTRNFLAYRDALKSATPPCIPFLGIYLTDLTFIEDGLPSLFKRTQLINFDKRAKTAVIIHDIQNKQNTPYALQPVPELQDYIAKNMQTSDDVHEMYDRSLQVEPREREDEKIARVLSESGFL